MPVSAIEQPNSGLGRRRENAIDFGYSRTLSRILFSGSLVLGIVHAWMGRYSMGPDGMSYLDVGDAFVHRNWAVAVNGHWSPLYPWALGVIVNTFRPSPLWEFPLVHAFNLVVFVLALIAFRFFLRSLILLVYKDDFPSGEQNLNLPGYAIELIGYATFLWASLELLTLYDVSPDLAVLACICAISGALIRLRLHVTILRALTLGGFLGVGYWTKTILLPLGIICLCFVFFWVRTRTWKIRVAQAAFIFVCLSAPLICLLSLEKGRITFGDSGRVAYAWAMSGYHIRNWQGDIPNAGHPVHGTRLVFRDPPVFEFDGPVTGTYPPWTDPSYWNEGLRVRFNLKTQLQILETTVPSEARILLRSQPAIVAGIIFLGLLGGRAWLVRMGRFWPLFLLPIFGMMAYIPILVVDRYVAGFVLVLFVLLIGLVPLRASERRPAIYLVFAVFAATILSTADLTVRIAMHHPMIPGVEPVSTLNHALAAEQLWRMGAQPGDKVAVIGDGTGAYWARLGKFRIVAEIMGQAEQQFWGIPQERKELVYGALRRANAKFVVSTCSSGTSADGWQGIANTGFCTRPLDLDSVSRGEPLSRRRTSPTTGSQDARMALVILPVADFPAHRPER